MSSDSQTATSVAEIAKIAREGQDAKPIKIGGVEFATSPVVDVRKAEPVPKPLVLRSLTSLVELVIAGRDESYSSKRGGRFIHVESPTKVSLVTGIFGDFNQRVVVAEVEAVTPRLQFGSFLPQEEFVIGLLTHFEETTDRGVVLAFVGNLVSEQVQTMADDGVSQTASAKKGLSMVQKVKVPTPVSLRPHRSFPDIAQPESPFVLRLRGGSESSQPTCALFECDGGRWVLDAVARIKAFLKTEVSGMLEPIEVYG